MLFREIQPGYPIFMLDRKAMSLAQGKVVNKSFPRIENNDFTKIQSQLSNNSVIDLTIESNGSTATYTMNDSTSLAYAGNLVISTDPNGLVNEVTVLRNKAKEVLGTIDYQKMVITKSDELLAELRPEYKQQIQSEERINNIENKLVKLISLLESNISPSHNINHNANINTNTNTSVANQG